MVITTGKLGEDPSEPLPLYEALVTSGSSPMGIAVLKLNM